MDYKTSEVVHCTFVAKKSRFSDDSEKLPTASYVKDQQALKPPKIATFTFILSILAWFEQELGPGRVKKVHDLLSESIRNGLTINNDISRETANFLTEIKWILSDIIPTDPTKNFAIALSISHIETLIEKYTRDLEKEELATAMDKVIDESGLNVSIEDLDEIILTVELMEHE